MALIPLSRERPGLYASGLVVITGGVADAVRRIDPDLVVVLNKRCLPPKDGDPGWRYEVYDRAAPGGPRWQIVLRVQEADGSFRPLDGRVLRPLYEARGRDFMQVLREMDRRDGQREDIADKRARALGEDLYEAFWAMGKRVVPTVAWRDRTDPAVRARIRAEAGLS